MSTNVFAWAIVEMVQDSNKNAQQSAIYGMKKSLLKEGIELEESNIFTCNYVLANGFLSAMQLTLIFTIAFVGLAYWLMQPLIYVMGAVLATFSIVFGVLWYIYRKNKRVVGFADECIFLSDVSEKKIRAFSTTEIEMYKRAKEVLVHANGKNYLIKWGKENEYQYYAFLRQFDLV